MVHLRYFKRAVKMEFNSLILTERGGEGEGRITRFNAKRTIAPFGLLSF